MTRLIKQQIMDGVVEEIDPGSNPVVGKVRYILHRHVRKDKETTKLRNCV